MKIPQWIQWAIAIIFMSGVAYSHIQGLPERVNSVEQKLSAVEANIDYIRDDVKWIRGSLERRGK